MASVDEQHRQLGLAAHALGLEHLLGQASSSRPTSTGWSRLLVGDEDRDLAVGPGAPAPVGGEGRPQGHGSEGVAWSPAARS